MSDENEAKDAKTAMPKYGIETHGSPASEEGIREDEGLV